MSLSVKNSISDQEIGSNGSNCCSNGSSQLKIYQTFIFSVPIFFTFILLFLFYWFYLRRRRADWSSLRMRANNSVLMSEIGDDLSRCELGLKKELREMLPVIVFNQSFSVKDTQCSVCLGEYQAEDKLQQIPSCEHTFHMDCIGLWLTTHTTCPLCRHSLLALTKPPPDTQPSDEDPETSDEEAAIDEDPQTSEPSSEGDGEGDAAIARDQDTGHGDEEGERETVK
ncbi:RING-H2 finger protein ATL58-like [Salvia splendens]|nr:RING-H2 finger protein ATL58-like [Salvia splendens]